MLTRSTSTKKDVVAWPAACFDVIPDGLIKFMAPPRSSFPDDNVCPGAMVDGDNSGMILRTPGSAQHAATLIVHTYNIAVLYSSGGSVFGINPARLVGIPVESSDLPVNASFVQGISSA